MQQGEAGLPVRQCHGVKSVKLLVKAFPEAALPWTGEPAWCLCFAGGFFVVGLFSFGIFLDKSCAVLSVSLFGGVASILSPLPSQEKWFSFFFLIRCTFG